MSKYRTYDTVAMNGEPDATVYRVTEIKGRGLGLIDATIDRPNQRVQWVDVSTVKRATLGQLEHAGLC